MNLDHYYTNDELESILTEWSEGFSQLARLHTIGKSFENRPINMLILTNQQTGPDIEKPAIWIDGNIHATEIAGTTAVLAVADTLLSQYGHDDRITRLLDTSTFYLLPRINPDGASLAMAANPIFVRSGVRAYPWEDRQEGLHQQDLDGDGRILQMRIPDPNGDWKVSSLDPRLMEKRDPDERGDTYYRLLPEGLLENYDGYRIDISRPYQGLDFNRNFPFEWRPENEQSGAGPFPVSESETRALLEFIFGHSNINIAITFHTFARALLRPYSTKADEELPVDDLFVYKKMGARGTQLTGYRCVSTFHDFKYHPKEVTTGAFDDWIYDHMGAFAFTIELWDLPTEAGIKDRKFIEWWRDHPHEEDLQILKWADQNAGEGAYVDWYTVQHPQLGPVELGGWNAMYTWRNPPVNYLGSEVGRHTAFMFSLAEMLPHLEIKNLEVTALEENVYRVNLVVDNTGFLPSFTSQQGKNRAAVRPVRAELELPPGAELASGKTRVEMGHLEGRSNKLDSGTVFAASPTDNRARVEWVVRASRGTVLKLTVTSERAGVIHKEIHLE